MMRTSLSSPSRVPTTIRESPRADDVGGRRRGKHAVLAHDRDDRASRESAGLRVAERPPDIRRVGSNGDLLHVQPGDLLAQTRELSQDQRAAEHLRQRDGLIVRQRDASPRARSGSSSSAIASSRPSVAEVDDRQAAPRFGVDVVAGRRCPAARPAPRALAYAHHGTGPLGDHGLADPWDPPSAAARVGLPPDRGRARAARSAARRTTSTRSTSSSPTPRCAATCSTSRGRATRSRRSSSAMRRRRGSRRSATTSSPRSAAAASTEGALIGTMYFASDVRRRSHGRDRLARGARFQGQGYAPRVRGAAARPRVRRARAASRLRRARPAERGIRRRLRSLGMRHEAHFVEHMWLKGEWTDTGHVRDPRARVAGERPRSHSLSAPQSRGTGAAPSAVHRRTLA